jgi:hypothetical protein
MQRVLSSAECAECPPFFVYWFPNGSWWICVKNTLEAFNNSSEIEKYKIFILKKKNKTERERNMHSRVHKKKKQLESTTFRSLFFSFSYTLQNSNPFGNCTE